MVCVARSSTCASSPRHLLQETPAHALGRQLDRRERILDLVRQAPRHLAPGGVALGLQQRGDVVEHDHVAALPLESCRRDRRPAAACRRRSVRGGRTSGFRSSCSRHSSSPVASREVDFGHEPGMARVRVTGRPAAGRRRHPSSTPRMVLAAWLALRSVRSGSSVMTPVDRRARMIDRRSRSRSTAIWLRCVSSRARRRRLVMSLKECTRKPISSRDGSGRRVSKSPLPTARVPAIRSCTGRTSFSAE